LEHLYVGLNTFRLNGAFSGASVNKRHTELVMMMMMMLEGSTIAIALLRIPHLRAPMYRDHCSYQRLRPPTKASPC
jgi:hypothetical protein